MDNSHEREQGERGSSCREADRGRGERDNDTQEELTVDAVADLAGNEAEERVRHGVDQAGQETVILVELRPQCSNLVKRVTRLRAKSGIAVGVVKGFSLPLNHNTAQQDDEENKVGVSGLELLLVDLILREFSFSVVRGCLSAHADRDISSLELVVHCAVDSARETIISK